VNHLRSLTYQPPMNPQERFPFSLTVLQKFDGIEFTSPVTFFVGENGTGKSTLLEGLAVAIGSITVGSLRADQDNTLKHAQQLAEHFSLQWQIRTKKGFFLRAEDFFGYVKRLKEMRMEMEKELENVNRKYQGRSAFAIHQARTPYLSQLGDMERRYGDGLDHQSHGESFLALFQNRFVPDGVYLLDEPEVPLSPLRQLVLLSMLKNMVANNAQFIIATHSPILLAFPGADIYSFDEFPLRKVAYDDLEHVKLTKDFLNNPNSFLRHL